MEKKWLFRAQEFTIKRYVQVKVFLNIWRKQFKVKTILQNNIEQQAKNIHAVRELPQT